MITAKKLEAVVDQTAPFALAAPWDNCGLLVDCGGETDKILFALDATVPVLEEAQRCGCGIVVTHHPAIFSPLKRFSQGDPALEAARRGLSLIAAHTCFDAAAGGVNDLLCDLFRVQDREEFAGIGRMGGLRFDGARELAAYVRERLGCGPVRYVDGGGAIRRVGVIGGAGGDFAAQAKQAGLDALITGECKHHEALYAKQAGLTLVAAGHYETENPAVEALRRSVEASLGGAAVCLLAERCENPFYTTM